MKGRSKDITIKFICLSVIMLVTQNYKLDLGHIIPNVGSIHGKVFLDNNPTPEHWSIIVFLFFGLQYLHTQI